jgi:hypothetical protein
MDTFCLTTAVRHFPSARSTYKTSTFNERVFFLTNYLQHAPLHYYAILHACFILYIYVVSITGCEVCLRPEGTISGAVLNHFVRDPDIYGNTLN